MLKKKRYHYISLVAFIFVSYIFLVNILSLTALKDILFFPSYCIVGLTLFLLCFS